MYHCDMKKYFFILFFWPLMAQAQQVDVGAMLVEQYRVENQQYSKSKRRFMKRENATTIQKLNPLWYLSGGLLFFYQNVLSEQIQAECNFKLSCSGYTKKCIEQHGLLVGIIMGADQLNSCQPNVYRDYETESLNENLKIINDFPN
jgi:putative component of membrane protein insertase Oxa1/YidC/SpoIIIJ protein YidD